MKSCSLLNETNKRVNYISFYETRMGNYEISLLERHQLLGTVTKPVSLIIVPTKLEII